MVTVSLSGVQRWAPTWVSLCSQVYRVGHWCSLECCSLPLLGRRGSWGRDTHCLQTEISHLINIWTTRWSTMFSCRLSHKDCIVRTHIFISPVFFTAIFFKMFMLLHKSIFLFTKFLLIIEYCSVCYCRSNFKISLLNRVVHKLRTRWLLYCQLLVHNAPACSLY